MDKIDFVFPYVNPADRHWKKQYLRYKQDNSTDLNIDSRFRDPELLKYIFRGLDKNMPWINNIYLIVSSFTQVPNWLDTSKVHVICHTDIIPKNYLPTFNSNTIEMFLINLRKFGISRNIIYSNDDIFLLNRFLPTDFFTNDNIPKIYYNKQITSGSSFFKMMKRTYKLISNLDEPKSFIKHEHLLLPLNLSTIVDAYNDYKVSIKRSITRFRDLETNLSQCLYLDYQVIKRKSIQLRDSSHLGSYYNLNDINENNVKSIIDNNNFDKCICINDTSNKAYNFTLLQNAFEQKFPVKSKFEKDITN